MPRGVRRVKPDSDVPAVSEKNTKDELLTAYAELSSRLEEAKAAQVSPRAVEEETRRQETVVQTVAEVNVEKIVRDMGELKLRVAGAVDDLTKDLMATRGRFEAMQEAVEIEKHRLEELYDIRLVADTLAMLVREYGETKVRQDAERAAALESFQKTSTDERARFELETAQSREAWKREQETHAAAVKERDLLLKRTREREEEEYAYTLKRTREKEADAYRQQQETQKRELAAIREKQERELTERERAVAEHEDEYKRLQKENAEFPARLDAAVKRATEEATARAEERASLAATLATKEAETHATLAKMRIEALEKTIAERDTRVSELRAQLEKSIGKVNDIALKAIEGASGAHAMRAVNEIALEQARHPQQK